MPRQADWTEPSCSWADQQTRPTLGATLGITEWHWGRHQQSLSRGGPGGRWDDRFRQQEKAVSDTRGMRCREDGSERSHISLQRRQELNKASTESLQSYMHVLQASGNITNQVVHAPGLREQLRQQTMLPLRTVTWRASFKKETKSVPALDALLGTVHADSSLVTNTEPSLPAVAAMDMGQIQLGQPTNTTELPSSFPEHDACITVALGNCVCAAAGSQLFALNPATCKSKKVKLRGVDVSGMTAIKSDTGSTPVISDYNKKLHFVKMDQDTLDITTHRVKDLDFEPGHISIDPVTGQLVIADDTNKAVVICDMQGNLCHRVTVQTDVTAMSFAVAAGDGYIILDDCYDGRIHWVDSQGRLTYTYGQGEGEHLCRPDHMVRDSQGRLVITDFGHYRLHLVDAHGQLPCYLLTHTDGIRHPRSVWLEDTTSQLYVRHRNSQGSQEIRVYKWPGAGPPLGPAKPTVTTAPLHPHITHCIWSWADTVNEASHHLHMF